MAKVSFPVGSRRLSAGTRTFAKATTRDVRAAMKQIIKNYNVAIRAVENASLPALKFGLQPIFDLSQELVPVRTGRLKRSGFIETSMGANGPNGVVGYARAGIPNYAALQHENLFFYHRPPTQAKYLEEAVKRHLDAVLPRYTRHVKQNLGL